jgi:hypothetical protein
VTNPATVIAELGPLPEDESVLLSNRYAVISETAPALRLSSAGWIDLTPASLVNIDSPELLFELCKEKIVTRIQPFSKRIRLFVERYLEFMQAQLVRHASELASELESDDILTAEDWIYSAWLPLPHAQIQLPAEFGPDFGAGDENFAELDVVFWTGDQLIGVQVEQAGSMIKSKREKLDYLKEHHPQIKIVSIPRDKLSESATNFPDFPGDLFDETFSCFWRGLSLPQGPNPSPILAKPFPASKA